ncbi:MAG TPA: hypothetical protein VIY51_20030 [Xanthobacteraceae bacterium]
MSENDWSAEAIERKLRALASVLVDPAATEHEKANAQSLKDRLEKRLGSEAPAGAAPADILFRLGRAVRGMRQSTAPPAPKGDWTDHAFRLGRLFRRGLRK